MDSGTSASGKPLVERAKAIILKPGTEWPIIADESDTPSSILKGYVLPLAAIGPLATLIGGQVFGYGALFVRYRPSLMSGLTSAILSYAMAIIGVFVLAWIANMLAPKFAGSENKTGAFKLVAYSMTAGWLAGIFSLIPALSVLGIVGLYSLYLFYVGAPVLMKVPGDKALGYTAVTVLCAIVLGIIASTITASVAGIFAGPALFSSSSSSGGTKGSGTITVPGVGSIDTDKIEQMNKQIEDAASGKTKAVSAGDLKGLLPESIGSYTRTSLETVGAGAVGTSAQARYTAGDKSFNLRIADLHGLGAIAGMGAAMGIEQSKEDADSYERTGTVDGQMQSEAWNTTTERGKFGRMVNNRFLIEAEGSANSIDELKSAVARIAPGDLDNLAD
ncbi:Yip1 family protein [Novosphingobium mangrovi (ex Huang et al. 2023)]|uniref:YIP1 family protein n=1 Tax=Novosphingobium mangrovi (ex Huang et al. 2023) TaxID=2976432 RepID=A0ABT2I786_9SPHN|nr:Yip1 family protein [Novosphingobium mangrovi (ex Huang et al. 2023)]MCT2400671.1 YIP1 family protein [Novosphingobium mangrovi (ex Huang et al. 2023)]